ncbi:MAG: RNA polymerase sigma factor [Deltaproteobacteria bacterium]|nr:RNA polymerase sigma factor [Deltaproteobacteria bacterium]
MTGKLVPLRRVGGVGGGVAELSDEGLLAACGAGDVAALGALFDRYSDAVYRFAGRFPLIDKVDRDDLVQTTFLEIRRTAGTFRGQSSVKTWILGVAANVARVALRSERRQQERQAKYLEQPTALPLRVDEQIEQRKLLARVETALAHLSREHQIVFILCDLEQLPGTEVAGILDIPEGTLWRRLHEARKAIRTEIERGDK